MSSTLDQGLVDNLDSVYRVQFNSLVNENAQLKHRVQALERENRDLKRSVFQLSTTASFQSAQLKQLASNVDVHFDKPSEVLAIDTAILPKFVAGASPVNGTVLNVQTQETDVPQDAIVDGQEEQEDKPKSLLTCSAELKGHHGAVYVAEWSPCGRMLASGGFDKSVRVWKSSLSHKSSSQRLLSSMTGHSQLISSICWTSDSERVFSGSFDHSVKLWEIESEASTALATFATQGLVQSLACMSSNNSVVFCGTSKGMVQQFDCRALETSNSGAWENSNRAMINTLQLSPCERYLLTGDAAGCIAVWDLRFSSQNQAEVSVVKTIRNEQAGRPITHLALSATPSSASWMGVNSYDNVLRVLDLNELLPAPPGVSSPTVRKGKKLVAEHDMPFVSPVSEFKGHQNKNWPIKSSIFTGSGYQWTGSESARSFGFSQTMLVASGSATSSCYVYDVSQGPDGGSLFQKLRGHGGRVYSCAFNPKQTAEPHLATCSADSTIRLWSPAS